MIKLLGFKKKYFNKTILEFKKVKFDQTGFYLIYGRSGCGKTTLLNCISLLEDFDGDYILNGINIKNVSDEEKANVVAEFASVQEMINAYNGKAKAVNNEHAEATEVAFAPIISTGFVFLSALWFLLKKKFFI